jgi:hypothetical protein
MTDKLIIIKDLAAKYPPGGRGGTRLLRNSLRTIPSDYFPQADISVLIAFAENAVLGYQL